MQTARMQLRGYLKPIQLPGWAGLRIPFSVEEFKKHEDSLMNSKGAFITRQGEITDTARLPLYFPDDHKNADASSKTIGTVGLMTDEFCNTNQIMNSDEYAATQPMELTYNMLRVNEDSDTTHLGSVIYRTLWQIQIVLTSFAKCYDKF